jgi:transcriptional regulator with XRE-family HTH domain
LPYKTQLGKDKLSMRLNKLMVERGWNQSELGRRAGLNRDNIHNYCKASNYPSPVHIDKIARAFGMTVSELLEIEDRPSLKSGQISMSRLDDGSYSVEVFELVTDRQTALALVGVALELGANIVEQRRLALKDGRSSLTLVAVFRDRRGAMALLEDADKAAQLEADLAPLLA